MVMVNNGKEENRVLVGKSRLRNNPPMPLPQTGPPSYSLLTLHTTTTLSCQDHVTNNVASFVLPLPHFASRLELKPKSHART